MARLASILARGRRHRSDLALYTVIRFAERDGGLYVEVEAIALSRDIPAAVRVMAEPIVRWVSRDSLITALQQTEAAVRSAGRGSQPMNAPTQFLLHHGYMILFLAVLAEQIGLAFPSSPLLLAASGLIGLRLLNPLATLSVAVLASLIGDSVWYVLGRNRGIAILGNKSLDTPELE